MELFNQTVTPGAAGFRYVLGSIPLRAFVYASNSSSVAATLTILPDRDTYSIPANGSPVLGPLTLNAFSLTGNGASIALTVDTDAIDPNQSAITNSPSVTATVSGTVTASISNTVGVSGAVVATSIGTYWTGGGVAPVTGIWTVLLNCASSNPPTVNSNVLAEWGLTPAQGSFPYHIPVQAGSSYTLGGTGVSVLYGVIE